jgi:hypothetical protein
MAACVEEKQCATAGGSQPFHLNLRNAPSTASHIKAYQDRLWFKSPIVEYASYVPVQNAKLRHQIERILIKFLKANAVLNKQQTESFSQHGGSGLPSKRTFVASPRQPSQHGLPSIRASVISVSVSKLPRPTSLFLTITALPSNSRIIPLKHPLHHHSPDVAQCLAVESI